MQHISIPADEYTRLIKAEAVLEVLDIYFHSTEYPNEKFIQKCTSYVTGYLPFTVPTEPKAKDEPETEEGWHE